MATIRDIIEDTCNANECPELCALIKYTWSNKMTRTFGRATMNRFRTKWQIKISRSTWDSANYSERENVVVHEVCHLIVWYKYNEWNTNQADYHGYTWQQCMRKAGQTPSRFHSVPVKRRTVGRVKVYCGCEEGCTVTKTLRTKMRNGSGYRCRKCQHVLRLTPDAPIKQVDFSQFHR